MYSQRYKYYALLTLTSIYLLSFMDRFMIGLFMQPIKEEFLLSDTQLGFLTGIAFAVFYATLGIPIARWADRGNRITITSIAIALWAVMVMLCGFVTSFFQLLLVRIGSAVGEAGVMPPAYSLITDYFPTHQRGKAISVYMIAIPLSGLVSFLLAGWIAEEYGWRTAFIAVGAPGLLMALLVKYTLREPRLNHKSEIRHTERSPSYATVITSLWRMKSYRYLLMGLTLVNFVGIGVSQWYAPFFIRSLEMPIREASIYLGLIGGVGGVLGIYLGGYLSDKYLSHNVTAQFRLATLVPILYFILQAAALYSPYRELSVFLLFVATIVAWLATGPMFTAITHLVEDKMRATAMAILSLSINLIGMGLGPQTVGILSDMLTPYLAIDALRAAMIISSTVGLGAAYCYWQASHSIQEDLLSPKQEDSETIILQQACGTG